MALLVIFFKWLQSYLDNRQQRVVICGSSSQWGAILAGVPQGSHLGPLLFIIYINDITEKIRSNIKLFADDTSLYVTIDGDAEDATEQLNDDLSQVSQWEENWLVKFSASKSKALTVTLKKKNTQNLDVPLSLNNSFGYSQWSQTFRNGNNLELVMERPHTNS